LYCVDLIDVGGQKQRISLARALLKRPKVLILDEATSQLDSNNEALIGQAILNIVRSGVAVLVIAHRLATIERADSVAYMEAGHIVEQGSHAELMNRDGGRYRQLVAIGLGSSTSAPVSPASPHTHHTNGFHSGDHGHSHGGGDDHGHSHGGDDHGHSHGPGGHAHSHGATHDDDDMPDLMDDVDVKIHGAPPQPLMGAATVTGPAPTPSPLPSISVAVHIPMTTINASSSGLQ
jgi:ABC-type multidrug transport system ATPase subunit